MCFRVAKAQHCTWLSRVVELKQFNFFYLKVNYFCFIFSFLKIIQDYPLHRNWIQFQRNTVKSRYKVIARAEIEITFFEKLLFMVCTPQKRFSMAEVFLFSDAYLPKNFILSTQNSRFAMRVVSLNVFSVVFGVFFPKI